MLQTNGDNEILFLPKIALYSRQNKIGGGQVTIVYPESLKLENREYIIYKWGNGHCVFADHDNNKYVHIKYSDFYIKQY